MSDHEIIWEFDDSYVRAKAQCNAPAEALCRNAATACDCEHWGNTGQDDQGWFHTVGEDDNFEVHRHGPSSYCNICEWLNADDIMECAVYNTRLTIGTTPIRDVWNGEAYDWEPVS